MNHYHSIYLIVQHIAKAANKVLLHKMEFREANSLYIFYITGTLKSFTFLVLPKIVTPEHQVENIR